VDHAVLARLRRLAIDEFIRALPLEELVAIRMICHTGKYSYIVLQERLNQMEDLKARERIAISVLARHPIAESTSRANAIDHARRVAADSTRRKVGRTEMRFYQALPVYQAVVCEYADGTRRSFISSYEWSDGRTRSAKFALSIRDRLGAPSPAVSSVETWMTHYWGNVDGSLHTLVFDFDDTLAGTTESQVKAWIAAIEVAIECGIIKVTNLANVLVAARADKRQYEDAFKHLFHEKAMAPQILGAALPDATEAQRAFVEAQRYDLRRKSLLNETMLFPGAAEKLRELSSRYQLAIVTATYGETVRAFLEAQGILDLFAFVLGKEDLQYEWENVHSKSLQLLQVSALAGIPLDRVVFIGDSSMDCAAAGQLGVAFVEATRAAVQSGRPVISAGGGLARAQPVGSFGTFEGKELDVVLDDIQRANNTSGPRGTRGAAAVGGSLPSSLRARPVPR
jgi:phosphoglycolate phosphatase-like HAD superfamily hydrolase